MAGSPTLLPESRLGSTLRRDPWWFEILPVVVVLGGFGIYATLRAFEGNYYSWGPYLSPFYSPLIDPQHHWWHYSPALLILLGPLGFRATCYYYRKAYYRAFLAPPTCAMPPPSLLQRIKYRGEASLPWVFNNLHRFALYLILVQTAILWYDAVNAFISNGSFHFGLGNVIMAVNVVCLAGYTLGCHAMRHLVGGGKDCFSCHRARYQLWKGVTVLNLRHETWAWLSMFTVWATDLYIRLLIHGIIPHAIWN